MRGCSVHTANGEQCPGRGAAQYRFLQGAGGEEPGMDFSFVDLQCYAHFIQNILYAGRASVNHGGRTIFFYGFQPIVRNGIKLENSGRGKINNK